MRSLVHITCAIILIAATFAAFAQTTGSIEIHQPWARATPKGASTGAVYMTLDNKTGNDDRLTGASSDVAAKLQIHEMAVTNGTMQMREVAGGLPIPAGSEVVLKPGGYHVMLMGLKKALMAGESFPLTLAFAKAGTMSVNVTVQPLDAKPQGTSGGMGTMEMK
jgi:periplasmic copper chaperone A